MSGTNLRRDATLIAIGLVIGGLIVAAGCAWLKYKPSLPSVLAPVSDDLAKIETELRECQKLQTYKPKAKKKLGLPETIQKDPDKHVVASSPVPPSDHPHTMTAVYDGGTGVVDMYLRQDPLPWLAFNRRMALGAAYGFKDEAQGFVTRVYGRIDLLQVKMLHAGLLGDVDNAGGWYGGAFIEGRW